MLALSIYVLVSILMIINMRTNEGCRCVCMRGRVCVFGENERISHIWYWKKSYWHEANICLWLQLDTRLPRSFLFHSLWCVQLLEKCSGTMCQRHNIINGMNQVCQLPYERSPSHPYTTLTSPHPVIMHSTQYTHKPNSIEKITCHISLRRRRQRRQRCKIWWHRKNFTTISPVWICSLSLSLSIVLLSHVCLLTLFTRWFFWTDSHSLFCSFLLLFYRLLICTISCNNKAHACMPPLSLCLS